MMTGRSAFLGILLAVLGPAAGSSADAPPPRVADTIAAEMKLYGIPGASIAVIRDYRIAWASGFGFADTASGKLVDDGDPIPGRLGEQIAGRGRGADHRRPDGHRP